MTGVFNVTMLVSNEYGRSVANTSLYRMSGFGEVYDFETYAGLNLFLIHLPNNFSSLILISG